MKYPFVIFYRKNEYNDIDKKLLDYSNNLNCTIFIADNINNIKNLYNSNYQLLITYGTTIEEYLIEFENIISKNMLVRHSHINITSNIINNLDEFNNYINTKFIELCSLDRELTRPVFSLFTPSYNSFNKILRVYNSLKKQTFIDWEWIIIDDSPDENNFTFLKQKFSNDFRIRFYKRSCNNGSIGNVKNETIGLCRGKYLLEMDHDDELLPDVLQDAVNLFEKEASVGFIYMDCACVYENGNNQWYGDFICKGYGGYYSQKYNNKWLLVYITPNINNITMSHLVCCPNHPRIWRKETLLELGSYCEYLPICDDYEIILKTSIKTKIAKIHKLGYIQYMNNSNNNFSIIRNEEINRIGPNYIYPIYYKKFLIHEKMKELNAYEDEKYIENHSKIWERDIYNYKHKFCNSIINNDYDTQYCIIGLDSLIYNIDKINELYKNLKNDFIVLENKVSLEYLQEKLEEYNFSRMKCYTLIDTNSEQLINYFKLLYLSTDNYEILNIEIKKPIFNSSFNNRYQIINSLTNTNQKYLEIGIEYGDTFKNVHFLNKIGVDPDIKYLSENDKLYNISSDEFFINNNHFFDIIFIDGMHQIEYVINDINNSIKYLNENGKIFIDDIMPLNYNEQLKIPKKHYYENNILKYGESWTGDVWKVIYYILTQFSDKITFKYYSNINYRGVALIQINEIFYINTNELTIINNYKYFNDYNNYLELIERLNNK